MNILMITGIFPPDIGGPATYVPTMASELVKRGHKVRVMTLSDSLDHDDRSYSFPVRRIRRGLFKPWRFLLTVWRILREARTAQVLYVNGLYIESVIANWVLRKPLVQKIVGDWAWERSTNKGWVADNFDDFQKRKYGPKIELLTALRRYCVRQADRVIVPSNYLARAVGAWGLAEEKISVVYNAVELPDAVPVKLALPTSTNIVTVGRLVVWKQIDQLIAALKECDQAGLVIVGDGPERRHLEDLSREVNVVDRVFFAGQRSKEETMGLMKACDLFVLNSTYEGFPHVVLEAMGAGLPVIATAVGGTPELVRDGENGVLLPPDSIGALVTAITALLSSDQERNRLAAGAQHVWQRFGANEMIIRTEAVLASSTLLRSHSKALPAHGLKDQKC